MRILISYTDRRDSFLCSNRDGRPAAHRNGRIVSTPHSSCDDVELMNASRISLLEYCRLIVISYGLQSEIASNALKVEGKSRYLEQSINAAFALVDAWLKRMVATQFVKYAPEFFFVGTGFAGAFLVKVRFASISPCLLALSYFALA